MAPERTVYEGDGVAWLDAHPLPASHAIVTSLPDSSEIPTVGQGGTAGLAGGGAESPLLDRWRRWFVDVVALACARVADDGVAVFYQTDVKADGRWVDKGYLVASGAERAGASTLFHKIVCRAPAGTTTFGRPAYAHLIAVSRARRLDPGRSTPDVLPALGQMTWARAMGTAACTLAARFLRDEIGARVVVDPFCGVGTMLAVANAHGLDAIGVERSRKRAERARALILPAEP